MSEPRPLDPTDPPDPDSGAGERLMVVRLLRLPVRLHVRAREHGESLRREFQLIADQARQPHHGAAPKELLALTVAVSARYSGFAIEQEDAVDAALEAGEPHIDLTMRVPAAATQAAAALRAMMDEADEYCREGKHMLTMATPPDLVAYRSWYLTEFSRQVAGLAPQPWSPGACDVAPCPHPGEPVDRVGE